MTFHFTYLRQLAAGLLIGGLLLSACATSSQTSSSGKTQPDHVRNAPESKKSGKQQTRHSGEDEVDRQLLERTFIEGVRAKSLGDLEGAIVFFSEVIKQDPGNAPGHFELARIYYEFSRTDDALAAARIAADSDPQNQFYQLLLADLLNFNGQHEQAGEVYKDLSEMFPDDPELLFQQAFSLQRAGEYEKAIKAYDRIEEQFGIEESVVLEKHKLYMLQGKVDKAAAEVEKLIEWQPDEAYFYSILAGLYETAGRTKDAETVYERMLALDTDDPRMLLQIAAIHQHKGNFEAWRKNLRLAFANDELTIDAKIAWLVPFIDSVGRAHFANEEMIFDLNELLVLAHPHDPKAYAMYGDFLYYDGRELEAREQYVKSLSIQQNIFDVWRQVFVIDIDRREWDSLLVRTRQATELFPNQPLVYYFNGIAHSQKSDFAEAVVSFKRSVPMSVGNPPLLADIYANLGNAYNELKEYEKSDEAYEKCLQITPDNAFVLNNYAYFLSLRSDQTNGDQMEKAREMSERSNQIESGVASFEDTYAWIRYKQGEFEDALLWIEKAISHEESTSAVLLDHYGDILFKLGRTEDAVNAWNRALENGMISDVLERKINDRTLYE